LSACQVPYIDCVLVCGQTEPYYMENLSPPVIPDQRQVKRDVVECDSTCVRYMATLDVDGDNLISKAEYQKWALDQIGQIISRVGYSYYTSPNETIDVGDILHDSMALFALADLDGDGYLNVTEAWGALP
jgi:EF hand